MAQGLVIMGKMGAGKTSASNYLAEHYRASSWTIAERIKQVSHALVDGSGQLGELLKVVVLDQELCLQATQELLRFTDSYHPESGKPRHLYQEVGQVLRDLDPRLRYCWEEDLNRRIQASPTCPLTVVDIRSREGYHFFVKERKYYRLRIDAPLAVRKQRLLSRDRHALEKQDLFSHQSETDVDSLEFDWVVDNSSSDINALRKSIAQIMQQLNVYPSKSKE
jgi:cytidylate kinase